MGSANGALVMWVYGCVTCSGCRDTQLKSKRRERDEEVRQDARDVEREIQEEKEREEREVREAKVHVSVNSRVRAVG
jgi:hypothetical protein